MTSTVSYTVNEEYKEGNIIFEIIGTTDKNIILRMAFHFAVNSINYDNKGIKTEIWRLLKYFPFDEEETFSVDFESYPTSPL
ncbi:hypothetical protein KCM76_20920 [Zooshikella marina]|uniref:hypothetical protein n=1 Tax=Zooshikella ganghwensis TaxID=202772 RepID=UPI001BAF107F|nr:hypothetical protein [Zooshikella ganghwensis]MBU2708468.1 hypothetical protein [Zooshikella ganghwensis]